MHSSHFQQLLSFLLFDYSIPKRDGGFRDKITQTEIPILKLNGENGKV